MDAVRIAFAPALAEKIPPGAVFWKEFNGSFQNTEITDAEIAGRIYAGQPFTTWHKNHWRTSANYICGQHVGLDFDTEDDRSRIKILLADPFIARYGSVVYTTPSHTPEKPRARVVFLIDTPIYQPANYTLAVSALLWMYNTADRQCKDPVRFFYGAAPGSCEMEWLGGVLPLVIVKDLIARYQATGQQARRTINRIHTTTPEQADVAAALKLIPPWGIPYDRWLAVLMAIHSQWPGNDGLSLAESWADGAQGEVERKWKGFNSAGNGAGAVTIATLFATAKEFGYAKVVSQ